MTDLLAKYEEQKFVVYQEDTVFGWISFDENRRVNATIFVDGIEYRAEPESADDKDIVLRKDGVALFKFKFDYMWGGAALHINGEDTGYEITGKFFKPGTRMVDENSNDLVVAVSDESLPPKIRLAITDPEASPLMIMATLYYHIYTSAAKLLNSIVR